MKARMSLIFESTEKMPPEPRDPISPEPSKVGRVLHEMPRPLKKIQPMSGDFTAGQSALVEGLWKLEPGALEKTEWKETDAKHPALKAKDGPAFHSQLFTPEGYLGSYETKEGKIVGGTVGPADLETLKADFLGLRADDPWNKPPNGGGSAAAA